MISVENINQLLQLIVIISPFVVGGAVSTFKLWKKNADQSKDIALIVKEFKPNGGDSLRDVINKITDSVQKIQEQIHSIDLTQKVYIDIDSNVPIFQTDSHGYLKWVNKSFLDLVSRPIEELLGLGWQSLILQDERDTVRREWEVAMTEKRIFEYCFHITAKDAAVYIKCKAIGSSTGGYVGMFYKPDMEKC